MDLGNECLEPEFEPLTSRVYTPYSCRAGREDAGDRSPTGSLNHHFSRRTAGHFSNPERR
jgi:hypothetical protein